MRIIHQSVGYWWGVVVEPWIAMMALCTRLPPRIINRNTLGDSRLQRYIKCAAGMCLKDSSSTTASPSRRRHKSLTCFARGKSHGLCDWVAISLSGTVYDVDTRVMNIKYRTWRWSHWNWRGRCGTLCRRDCCFVINISSEDGLPGTCRTIITVVII